MAELALPGADVAAALIATLTARGETVATCESLTGGLVAAALTSVPGSSLVVRGGLVTYATELKVALAGVRADTAAAGVVTEATAVEMAAGARGACGADWGIATTGVAGPGPSDGVAAGTVWIAVAGPRPGARLLRLDGDRTDVRAQTVVAALTLLRDLVGGAPE